MAIWKARFLPYLTPLFAVIFFLIGCNSEESNTNFNENNLKLIKSFPAEKNNIFLKTPVDLTYSDEEIFISDQPQSTVFVFDYDGNYRRKIGRPGAGPREFRRQLMIRYHAGKLFVGDQGNRRFSIFNFSNDSVQVELLHEVFWEFAVSSDKIFGYYSPIETQNLDSLSLISVYDHELNNINSFGEFLNFTGNMPAGASRPHLEVFNDRVYISFKTFPLVKVYDLEGNLIKTLELEGADLNYGEIVERNYESETYDSNTEGPHVLVRHFAINEQGLFLLVSNHENSLFIDHFDHDGNFLKRYRQEITAEEFYLFDMKAIIAGENNLRFYVLSISDGIPKVDIYEAETNNQQTASLP